MFLFSLRGSSLIRISVVIFFTYRLKLLFLFSKLFGITFLFLFLFRTSLIWLFILFMVLLMIFIFIMILRALVLYKGLEDRLRFILVPFGNQFWGKTSIFLKIIVSLLLRNISFFFLVNSVDSRIMIVSIIFYTIS